MPFLACDKTFHNFFLFPSFKIPEEYSVCATVFTCPCSVSLESVDTSDCICFSNTDTLSSFCFSDSRVSEYASYVSTILHLAQNLLSGLFGSLQLGHCFGLNASDNCLPFVTIPYASSMLSFDSFPK